LDRHFAAFAAFAVFVRAQDSASKNAPTGGATRGGAERVSRAPGAGGRIAAKNSMAAPTLR
jgi:hypothetical protein